jgi:putative heme iron utilization protein
MPESDRQDRNEGGAEDAANNARRWLLMSRSGTLCTLSTVAGLEGWPFGSIVPYALDGRGQPLILTASIAAHTKHMKADARASLFVHERRDDGDPQAGWRLTVLGRMTALAVDDPEIGEIDARYVERVPAAASYLATHDFHYWRLSIDRVRYIGGFGKICWLDRDDVTRDPMGGGLAAAAAGIIAHMNEDHGENMREMCRGLYGFAPSEAVMTSVDRTGFMVATSGPVRVLRFSFRDEVDAAGVRTAVIEVLKRARVAGP